MTNPDGSVALPWPAWRSGAGVTAVLIATVLAIGVKELLATDLMGATAAFGLCMLLAVAHLAVVLVVAFRTHSVAWLAYAALSIIAFVAIGAVTPVSAALLLLRLNLV